jgi:hypothetical protein
VVLHDNLFGLEIDGRCVQIAAFAVALAAWRLAGGWQALPLPHIAWSGAPPPLPKADFVALANDDADMASALAAIHDVFRQAPLLGCLIQPTGGDLIDPVRIAVVKAILEPVIERARTAEPERAEGAIAARGMADAVGILARRYTLQGTNVPFLGAGQAGLGFGRLPCAVLCECECRPRYCDVFAYSQTGGQWGNSRGGDIQLGITRLDARTCRPLR